MLSSDILKLLLLAVFTANVLADDLSSSISTSTNGTLLLSPVNKQVTVDGDLSLGLNNNLTVLQQFALFQQSLNDMSSYIKTLQQNISIQMNLIQQQNITITQLQTSVRAVAFATTIANVTTPPRFTASAFSTLSFESTGFLPWQVGAYIDSQAGSLVFSFGNLLALSLSPESKIYAKNVVTVNVPSDWNYCASNAYFFPRGNWCFGPAGNAANHFVISNNAREGNSILAPLLIRFDGILYPRGVSYSLPVITPAISTFAASDTANVLTFGYWYVGVSQDGNSFVIAHESTNVIVVRTEGTYLLTSTFSDLGPGIAPTPALAAI